MKRLLFSGFFVFFLLGSCWASASDYYNFTNAEGQALRAKFVRMQGARAEIQREDGAKFVVDPAIFIEKDRNYIAEQAKHAVLSSERSVLDIKTSSVTTRPNKVEEGALIVENYNGFYKIKIVNTSDIDLKRLTVEYRYFIFSNEIGGDRRNSGRTLRTEGKNAVAALPPRGEIELETQMTKMKDSKLRSGWVWTEGGKRSSSDQLRGIWVRVYMGDTLIGEVSTPNTLKEKESW